MSEYQQSVLNLETLQAEYDTIMSDYEQAQSNYIGALNDSGRKFVTMKNRMYISDDKLWNGQLNKKFKCKSKCKNDDNCTGATYNSWTNKCNTYGGDGEISIGGKNSFAIVSKVKQTLLVLQEKNSQLINKSLEIDQALQTSIPVINDTIDTKNEQKRILLQKHQALLNDREEINTVITEFDTMGQENDDKAITVNQKNSYYIVVFLFTILLGIITFKQMLFPEMESNIIRFTFWFILLSIFTINVFQMNTVQGFFIVFLLILIILLILMNIIPSP